MTRYKELLKLCQKLIVKSVGKGIDRVGKHYCGPAWPYIKKVFTPVVDKLKQEYPDLFDNPQEAEKAAGALVTDTELQQLIAVGFENLTEGHNEILAALTRQDELINDISITMDEGFKISGDKQDEILQYLVTSFRAMQSRFDALESSRASAQVAPDKYANITVPEIISRSNRLQSDAMRWLVAGDNKTAEERLGEARELLTVGLNSEPGNNNLLVAFGFVEKTQAQMARIQGDYDGYVEYFIQAAQYFGKALANDPEDVGALNGMVNVYISNKDYDSAIRLGKFATISAPNYGAAFWDLAIAYEKKLKAYGQDRDLIQNLIRVYDKLLVLIPNDPYTFSAKDLIHVQNRIVELRKS
jgi:tetratricopeptide (TPR) repeat protein